MIANDDPITLGEESSSPLSGVVGAGVVAGVVLAGVGAGVGSDGIDAKSSIHSAFLPLT